VGHPNTGDILFKVVPELCLLVQVDTIDRYGEWSFVTYYFTILGPGGITSYTAIPAILEYPEVGSRGFDS
jgi:hypothetical protein